ncbi:LacI family transcriptional regulator [Cerasicoccus arenae]|uniref:LacI family transcriptional regulator n=2 Tax=Cerasicoccus arenae TaxID=424488 RepID=A0A8J3GFU5_9BACT|nr:LacI family transcriptional regulator [Cerasicoccus arenae]
MEHPKRVTQRDLASHLSMSQVTVSRALSNHPQVSPPTRKRVLDAARELGYQPDPVLGSLNAYRRTRMPIEKGQSLAWIIGQEEEDMGAIWYDGALLQANQYGYRLEKFNPNADGMTPNRVMKILYSRSVSGLIFAPRRQAQTQLNIEIDPFSAVAIGYTLLSPIVDRVITDHHNNLMRCFQNLYNAGYRRIGMATTLNTEKRVEGRRISAFLYQQYCHPDVERIPIVQYPNTTNEMSLLVKDWIKQWEPEAILCHSPYIFTICKELNLQIPKDIAIVSLAQNKRWPNYKECSGIDELGSEVGAFAVDTLVAHIRNNERGSAKERYTHMLEGRWNPGKTMIHPTLPLKSTKKENH